jgi:NADPH:quinone reductase-like Zn-dependent oxidoreductase
VTYRYWFMRADGGQLALLLGRIAGGNLKVKVAQEFPLAQAPDALRVSETGRVHGKLVIRA